MDCINEGFTARPYQEQLLQYALNENVVIYLPTGAGKTCIALMALEQMSKDLQGSLSEGGKRSIFLCNTIALAKQQYEVIQSFTKLRTRCYTGDMNIDHWKRDKWEIEFDKYQVFVSTCQIIVDCVRHNFVTISDFNLLIFDECHHAQGEHPMHQLMKSFMYCNQSKLPRVIGLTGLLINSSTKASILKNLNDLEAVFRAKIITVKDFDEFHNVLLYSTKPTESLLKFNDLKVKLNVNAKIACIVNNSLSIIKNWIVDETHLKLSKNMANVRNPNVIKKLENLLNDLLYQMEEMGIYAASIAALDITVDLELKKRSAETSDYRKLMLSVLSTFDQIRHVISYYIYDSTDKDEKEHEVIMDNSTPKLQTFLYYLENKFVGREMKDIKCLVFVERRYTARILYHIIKAYVKSKKTIPIVPEFMVGNSDTFPESVEYILERKYSRKILNKFQKNECNMIIATSVLEEGIDVQSCNYVFLFDKLLGFRQYVQTKGRARMESSDYVIMVPESDYQKSIKKIQNFREMDFFLKHYLIGKAIDRNIPLIEETNKQFEVLIEPFISATGARLEAESAISLLYRYCASLPNDFFTNPSLSWSFATKVPKVILKLQLPIQSTVTDEILSDPMDTVKMAKKSAAFKACKSLYHNGEFDDYLLPITNIKRIDMIQPKYFQHWQAFPTDHPKTAGTRKNRRKHEIQYPSETSTAAPKLQVKCYMHSISMEPQFETTDKSDIYIFNTLKNPETYGILLTNKIPALAAMPLFMSQGEVFVKISQNPSILMLQSEEEITKLRNFHLMIFKDLLRYPWTAYLAINYQNNENSFMIVPLNTKGQIDWNIVNNFQSLTEGCPTNDFQRTCSTFNGEDFLNKVVSTWYTPDNRTRYMVKAIREDLNPLSPFPNQTYETFADFIEEKYQVKIQNNTQFLIEVQPITSRQNFLLFNPGNRRKYMKKFDSIILIPEICYNFNFSSTFWLKAKLLPSILHRFHFMLIAEDIRNRLNNYLSISCINYVPEPLIVDKSLPRVITGPIEEDIESRLPSIDKNHENVNTEALINKPQHEYNDIESVNINRSLTELYNLDVEYVSVFKEIYEHGKMLDINEDPQFEPHKINSIKVSQNRHQAICDVNNRNEIKLLNIIEPQSPEQWEILAAITAAGANDVFDMERMEVLGDCFLKFIISLYLLKKHPHWNEGHLTTVKGQFVSNRNLFYISVNIKLPGALKSREFKGDEWLPPLISVPQNAKNLVESNAINETVFTTILLNEKEILNGECEQGTLNNLARQSVHHRIPNNESEMCYLMNKYWISDKVCADAIEALLGVCVQKYGILKSCSILQFFGICTETDFDLQNLLKLDFGSPRLKTNIPNREIDAFLLNYEELEKNISYKFKDRAYLLQAMTHPSYPTNRITGCYQQLEFIGDAILDFLITSYIFEKCKDMDPGKLTDLRSALVNNITLAGISVRNKFHLFMLSRNASLTQSIMRFYEFQKSQEFRITHQVRILLLEHETNDSMADYINVPKALGDIFEALIGAIFLDSNNDLRTTWNVIYSLMQNEIEEYIVNVPIQVVRQLQEYHGADYHFSPPTVNDDLVMVKCQFTCRGKLKEVNGFGKNKEQAQIAAAKLALQTLYKA